MFVSWNQIGQLSAAAGRAAMRGMHCCFRAGSTKVSTRELSTGARLQVPFERTGSLFFCEFHSQQWAPRPEPLSMSRLAGVVGCQSFGGIRGQPDVVLLRIERALKQVHESLWDAARKAGNR
jgi:hypothetical protein